MTESKRIEWVDVGKGISILLVVVYHAHIFLNGVHQSSPFYEAVANFFRPVRMPLFFAMSGALATSAIQKEWPKVLEKKVWYFFYLFAIWSFIHLALFKYVIWHPSAHFDGNIVLDYLSGLIEPHTGIWFIWALIFYFAAAKVLRPYPVVAVVVSLAFGVVGHSGVLGYHGFNFAQQNLIKYLPFFIIPALFGKTLLNWAAENPVMLVVVGLVLAAVSLGFPDLNLPLKHLDEGTLNLLLSVGGLCAGVAISILLSKIPAMKSALSFFGRHTLPIYLGHILLLSVLTQLAMIMGLPKLYLYGVPLLGAIAISLCLGFERIAKPAGVNWLLQPASTPRQFGQAPS